MAGDISHDFDWAEFAQPARHGFARMEVPETARPHTLRLVDTVLQPLRDQLGVPISILSGYRSPAYNRAVKGARNSRHVVGDAADIRVHGWTPADLHEEILRRHRAGLLPGLGGLGRYSTFTHVDARPTPRLIRWLGTRRY